MMLDAISLVSALAYLAFVVVQLFVQYKATTAERLYAALTWCLLAVVAQVVHLAANILDTDSDGWVPVGLSLGMLLMSLVTSWFIAKRAAQVEDGAQ